MTAEQVNNKLFGDIAVEMKLVDQVKIDKALVVQKRIFDRTRVNMPIGEILIEMGVITAAIREDILQIQREIENKAALGEPATAASRQAIPAIENQRAGATVNITVSKDKLRASAHIDGMAPVTDMDVDDIKLMLHSEGILCGIADDERIAAFLSGAFGVGESWDIATGTEPIPDAPPEVVYHFDTDPLKVGTLTEEGLMDWKERGQLPQVKAGDLLAEKIPGPKGKEGMDVYGKKIPVPKMREQRFKCSKGARRSADGLQVHATLAGIPRLSLIGEMSVLPILKIDGDICLETGHVTFEGHIDVAGAVEKGYRVNGGSLRANEIRSAQIDIDGDIYAANGIFGATMRCGGNLKAGHIHNADIVVAGDIAVEKEIIESTVEANGRCLITDGIIISSTVSAKMGVNVMDIGTGASKSSELIIGIDRQLERESDAVKTAIQNLKTERQNLPKQLDKLRKRSDEINTRLGEVAQEQDKCMVQHRRLQEKVEAGLLRQGGVAAEKLRQTMAELKARQDAFDQDVAELMAEDESIGQEISTIETAITESAGTIKDLNQRLEAIADAQKTDPGRPVVKIGGNVYAGTQFTGPHGSLILDEDLKHLSVVETDKPDHDGAKRWRFEINALR